ncbi:MAG TPA: ATP-binding protein, partial [Anaerolineae bacterium]|nr:ATP-binding protein [Anaerolineae bacterium]
MFINRERELDALERSYGSGRAELYVLYGRRRVGKTELLRAFCQGKRHIFFVADLGTETSALAEFTRQISQFAYDRPDAISAFSSWDAAFEFLSPLAAEERLVVVLDEFTYLIEANSAIPSILQRLWDTHLRETQLMLILCGSYVGMMEQHVLAYRAPLYGRRTAQWHLQPLTFWDVMRFLSYFNPIEQVRAYAILGGVPAYLLQFDDGMPLLRNIEQRILTPGTFLYDEPRFLLLQELREPHRYFSVLEAIAAGRTRQNEIAQVAGIVPSSISFYLSTLRELGLVERVVPATEKHPHKSKRGLYRLLDNYFRFWFRFIYPNRSLLERGEMTHVRRLVKEQLDQFTSPAFEAICREYVWRLHQTGELGFTPQAVGSWWDRQEEVDVVAVGEEELLVGECKWRARPVGTNILDDLKRKAHLLIQQGNWTRVHYALFSRSGFTSALEARA